MLKCKRCKKRFQSKGHVNQEQREGVKLPWEVMECGCKSLYLSCWTRRDFLRMFGCLVQKEREGHEQACR